MWVCGVTGEVVGRWEKKVGRRWGEGGAHHQFGQLFAEGVVAGEAGAKPSGFTRVSLRSNQVPRLYCTTPSSYHELSHSFAKRVVV